MKSDAKQIIVTLEHTGIRLDVFLVEQFSDMSRSAIKKMIDDGRVKVNENIPKKAGMHLSQGDVITFEEHMHVGTEEMRVQESAPAVKPDAYDDITVIADEDEYLVVEKPSGILVHPTMADESFTLKDWLLEHYPELHGIGENMVRPGIVHRLDKEASGLLVIAKTQHMFVHLKSQFKARSVQKEYTVLVHGSIASDYDDLTFRIDRGKDGRMVARPYVNDVTVDTVFSLQPGKEARTELWVEKRFVNFTLLRVKIHSGRTHQIRVHMYAYNHPVVGDLLYMQKRFTDKKNPALNRLFLHASILSFETRGGDMVTYHSALPDDLEKFLHTCVESYGQ